MDGVIMIHYYYGITYGQTRCQFILYEIVMKYLLLLVILFMMYYFIDKGNVHKIYGSVARSSEELKRGLMFRKHKLNDKEGMLFIMRQNYDNSVWMKNTYISLDVIFLDDSMKVIGYKTNTTPLSTKSVKINLPSSYILEMNANSVNQRIINIGDSIQFTER